MDVAALPAACFVRVNNNIDPHDIVAIDLSHARFLGDKLQALLRIVTFFFSPVPSSRRKKVSPQKCTLAIDIYMWTTCKMSKVQALLDTVRLHAITAFDSLKNMWRVNIRYQIVLFHWALYYYCLIETSKRIKVSQLDQNGHDDNITPIASHWHTQFVRGHLCVDYRPGSTRN